MVKFVKMVDVNEGVRRPHSWRDEFDHLYKKLPPIFRRKAVFVDIETTGVQVERHQIIDIAVVGPDEKDEWQSKMHVSDTALALASEGAIKVTGFKKSEWVGAPKITEVLTSFMQRVRGHVLIGHNIMFDIGFIRRALGQVGIPADFLPPPCVDTYMLAKQTLTHFGLKKFALDACNEFLGLPREGDHRALGGALACKRLYETLTNPEDLLKRVKK